MAEGTLEPMEILEERMPAPSKGTAYKYLKISCCAVVFLSAVIAAFAAFLLYESIKEEHNSLKEAIERIESRETHQNRVGRAENFEAVSKSTSGHIGQWETTRSPWNPGTLWRKSVTFPAGEIDLIDEQPNQRIYFAIWGGGIKTCSIATCNVSTVVDTNEDLRGIAFDPFQQKLYWSSNAGQIFRGNLNGSDVETVFNSSEYKDKSMNALAFDWVTKNIYAASSGGDVLVCNTTKASNLSCAIAVRDQGDIKGIALDPINGLMYWTTEDKKAVVRASMDGLDKTELFSGLKGPRGIAVDIEDSRIYFADMEANNIQSSDGEGTHHRIVMTLPANSGPYGVTLLDDRIYCTNHYSRTLQSCTKHGENNKPLAKNEASSMAHLVAVPMLHFPNRTNPCANESCSTVCALTTTSSRCLN